VHNGTVISFTTTVGRIEPNEAPTHNGQVTVRLVAGGQSGTARITAFSGGARSAEVMVNVGTAAVERVLLRADNQNLPASGGSTRLIARVEDVGGAGLVGVPVTFTTTAGRVEPSSSNTDANGEAVSTLTTALEANVTASAGSKTSTPALVVKINPRSSISITPPTTTPSAGQPATFTIGVGATSQVTNVRVTWGDGSSQNLGALSGNATVLHTYTTAGNFTVTATATTAFGDSEAVSTAVTVLPEQPPAVIITPNEGVEGNAVNFTATVTGATSTIISFDWTFGDGGTANDVGSTVSHTYAVAGIYTVRATVTLASGATGTGQTSVNIRTP
jgi:adhesin/invasin